MTTHALSRALVCLLLFGAAAASAQDEPITISKTGKGQVTIDAIEWGFDGRALPRRFVPLSILLKNDTEAPAQGRLALEKSVNRDRVDVSWDVDYYVSPLSSRWVQFATYYVDDYETYTLTWGPESKQRSEIPTPRNGEPNTVLFVDPEAVQPVGGALRRCDEIRFPASVTLTESLSSAALAHAPDWSGARAQAFIDWLHAGGRLYLLHDTNGAYPRFPAPLEFLNDPSLAFQVQAGAVIQVPDAPSEIDRGDARLLSSGRIEDIPRSNDAPSAITSSITSRFGWDRDGELLDDLAHAARLDRRWWLVYLGVLAYLLIMYPGCYWVGRHVPDWRRFYLAFLSSAALFAFGFAIMGRVGRGQTNRVRAAAVAQVVADGVYDVSQWSCLAVTTSGDFAIQHEGTGRCYAAAQEIEPVDGRVDCSQGIVTIRLPPASVQRLVHGTRLDGPKLQIKNVRAVGDGIRLIDCGFQLAPGISDELLAGYVWHDRNLYQLESNGDGAVIRRRAVEITSYLTAFSFAETNYNAFTGQWSRDKLKTDEQIDNYLRWLIGNSIGLTSSFDARDIRLAPDRARVFLLGRMPPEFFVQGGDFPDQSGYVLYAFEIPVNQ